MKENKKILSGIAWLLLAGILLVTVWGVLHRKNLAEEAFADQIEQVDLDTIHLENSGVSVSFEEVILSRQNETRKLVVSTQPAAVSIELTDRLIEKLDFDFLKKSQKVTYAGTGYFIVDLDALTPAHILADEAAKTVTIQIGHAHLEAIEIDPNKIIIDEVKESLLARGDIKLTVSDYNAIEKEIRRRMEARCNTAENAQKADDLALKAVKEIYDPVVKAVDHRYSVVVEFV